MYDIVQNTRCTQSFKVHSSFKKEEEGPKAQSGQRQLGALNYFFKDGTRCHDVTACNYECLGTSSV